MQQSITSLYRTVALHLVKVFYSLCLSVSTVDYESTTFEIDSDIQCIDVTIINDGVVEPMEEFTVEISAISPFVDIGTTSSAVVTITDDDSELAVF